MRPLSLRTKLVCTLAVIVSIAACPLIYFGYVDTLERTVSAAKDKFEKNNQILEEQLSLSYLDGQTLVTEKAAIEKGDIIKQLDSIEHAILSNEFGDLQNTLKFTADAWGTHTAIVSEWGEYLYLSPLATRMIRQNVSDYLGVPFRSYLRSEGSNFYRDFFTFIRIDVNDRKKVPFMIAVRKITGYTVLIMQNLDYLEGLQPKHMQLLEGHLRDTVRALEIGPKTNFSVVAGDGRVVVSKGPDGEMLGKAVGKDLLDGVRREGRIKDSGLLQGEEKLYSLAYFRPLDWTIISSVPMNEISRPAEAYAQKLIGMVIGISWVVALLGLLMVSWFLRPLNNVSNTARRLEAFDFLQDNTAERLRELISHLPQHQRDEIGQVSRAFASMVMALEKNIKELKESVARQHNIEGELNAAHEIQLGMLPDASNGFRAKGMEAAAVMNAAKEVGGDFYDVFDLPDDRQVLILGDVSGKGVSAALFMCVTLTLIRNAIGDGLMPAQAVKKVNDQLAANNPNMMFVTLWVGILDRRTGRLVYANGGHCPPAILPASPEKPVRWLRDISGPLVGAFDIADFNVLETTLEPGDVCFVYSDGVSEAMDEEKHLFGEEGMIQVFESCHGVCPQGVINAMMAGIEAHRGKAEQSDDITMLVFEYLSGAEGADDGEAH